MLKNAQKLKKQLVPPSITYPNQLRAYLEDELECLLKESLDQKNKEMVSFQKRITKYKDHVFTFLYHPNAPPDNNGSKEPYQMSRLNKKYPGSSK